MKLIKFPSIDQFKTIVSNVKYAATYVGQDAEGRAQFNPLAELPVITFIGTVKLHGTNAAICYDTETKEMWCQSRENIIDIYKDNCGFASYVAQNESAYKAMFEEFTDGLNDSIVSVYGEWCGQGVQKGVAISELPKMFVVFGCKITPPEDKAAFWISTEYFNHIRFPMLYNVSEAGIFAIDIDFSKPAYSLKKLVELTLSVEEECPFANMLGVKGIGEGIVWTADYKGNRYIFKTKGEKHSKSKVSTVKVTVSAEKLDNITKVVQQVTPSWRMDQGLTEVFDLLNGGELDIKRLGEYIAWVMKDICKEESDVLIANSLEPKDIGKYVAQEAKKYFQEATNKSL